MTKTLMLAFALLLSTAWLQAQNQPASEPAIAGPISTRPDADCSTRPDRAYRRFQPGRIGFGTDG